MALAYFSGIRERQRLGSLQLSVGAAATIFDDENEEGLPSMSEENAELRRPKLFWLNAGLTIALMTGLVMEITPRNTCRSRLAGDGLRCAAVSRFTRVIVDDHRWQASSYKDRAIPVGAGLLAMDSSAPRLSGLLALSLTTIAGKPAPTRDRAIPVGAGLPAMDSGAPRLSRSHALSLTTIAGKPAPTRAAQYL